MLNDCVTVHNRKAPKYAEIFKLSAELAERDIPFELKHIVVGDFKKAYLYYPCNYVLFSQDGVVTVQEIVTNGCGNAPLEITDQVYDEVEKRHVKYSVGGLTAEEVLERILKKEAEKNG